MARMYLLFLLASTLGAALLVASLRQHQPPTAHPSYPSIRVLLSYQPGAGPFDEQYPFPNLSPVPLVGSA